MQSTPQPTTLARVKRFFYWLMEDPDSSARPYFNVAMMVVVMASVVEMVLEVNPELSLAERHFYHYLDDIFIGIFLVEYLLRWWLCSDFTSDFNLGAERYQRRLFHRRQGVIWLYAFRHALGAKLRWMVQILSIIDLLAILPVFRPFRLLRILMVLRVLKLFRYSRRLSLFMEVVRQRGYEIITLGMVGMIVWGMVAIAFYVAERADNPKVLNLGDALYWSIITIATVGYGDITPVTTLGRTVAGVGVIMGAWVIVFMTSTIVTALTEHVLNLREHRMERQIERMRDHFIVCGLDNLGQSVCRTLVTEGKRFVGVDLREPLVEDAIKLGWTALQGNVTDDEVWERLGLARARCVISTIADEASSVFLILLVRERRPDCMIVACGATPEAEKRLLRLGANRVISPFQIGGMQMAYTALRPTALQFLDLALKRDHVELEMEELIIPPESSFANVSLRDTSLRQEFDVIVVGIVHQGGRMQFNPRADTILLPGDILICLGHLDDLERMRRALNEKVQ